MSKLLNLKISESAMELILIDLHEVASACIKKKIPYAVADVCTTVANLIASAGTYGDTDMTRMMDLAEKCGFTPVYYGTTIRVHFESNIKENNG
jgi:hypothetical protein